MSIFGKRITELREMADLDVKSLAFRCDWSRSRLSNYENGIREPGLNEVIQLSEALKPVLGGDYSIYILTGKKPDDFLKSNSANTVTVAKAVKEFRNTISDAVDFGRIKLDPSLKISDLVESFVKACESDPVAHDQKAG